MNAAGKPRPNSSRSQHRNAAAKRRREQIGLIGQPGGALEQPRARRRLLTGVAIVVLVVAVGTGAFYVLRDSSSEYRSLHGALLAAKAPEQAISATPAAYRLTFTVDVNNEVLEEETTLRRPFDERHRIAILGQLGTPVDDEIKTKSYTSSHRTGQSDSATKTSPALSPFETRFDITLHDLVDNGFYVRRERRKVLNTECTVYRTGASIEGRAVTKATAATYTDLCIADDGLVLEEVGVTANKVDLRVVATMVERDLALTDNDFPVNTDPTALSESGVEVIDIDTHTLPKTPYWQWTTPPDGWTLVSRQRVEDTNTANSATTTTVAAGPSAPKISWVDVYRRDNDLLIVRQGSTDAAPDVGGLASDAIPTTVGDLGNAKLLLGTTGTELVVDNSAGRFVHVSGSISLTEMTSLTSSLQLANG